MTCEDTPVRLSWLIELYEPASHVWICKGYGRATTTAAPADIARAILAGYLAANPPQYAQTLRAVVRPDTGTHVIVTADQLPAAGWGIGPDVLQALPLYLREALPDCDSVPADTPNSIRSL